ncbi:MAG: hypothetical protein WC822_06030 [Candidatus Paceibacterota bacterium]
MKSTMYRQGNGWIVSSWDEAVECYRLSGELSYWQARQIVGEENYPHRSDGKCQIPSHQHLELENA